MVDPYTQWQVPQRLSQLKDLAYNLWWSWHPEARALFKAIDRSLWTSTHHNPVLMLQQCPARLEALANDSDFLARYDAVIRSFGSYMGGEDTWFKKAYPELAGKSIAYFSAEFGVHNSLRIYSGGLGILAGDHCKTASDLGVPLVGVGFMYPQGYVQQRVGVEGWQQNVYEHIDWQVSPVRPVMTPSGERLVLELNLGGWPLRIAVWKVAVGRVHLYLMDTNVDGNSPQDREISGRLYGGDRTMRLRQEIVLGIGGMRMLRSLDIPAAVFHVNEGHAAFLFLERIRELVESGQSFQDASREVAESSVFTTHTPVAAGHDVFTPELISEYFKNYWPSLGLSAEQFMELAGLPGETGWNMTALALRFSSRRNGVSRLHGQVSRRMWAQLWPERPLDQVPIGHVTNGVHLPTWVQQELTWTYAKYLGQDWKEKQDDPAIWSRVAAIPDDELWGAHRRNKEDLFKMTRDRARLRWMQDHVDSSQVLAQGSLLDPTVLTIGFARRFASYKRANLILRDLDRLKRLLLDASKPVQILFAGKAHPDDNGGKLLIQKVYNLAKDPAFGGRIVFIEDYDMHVARYIVHGCDLWLNNPQPPLEACGTSGIKAAVNGVPNLSVLDGWWAEGYNSGNGWTIGFHEGDLPGEATDAADADELYRVLEEKIVPLYYDRVGDGLPHNWIKVMKESIRSVAPRFSGNRMVKEYVDQYYVPALNAKLTPSGKA